MLECDTKSSSPAMGSAWFRWPRITRQASLISWMPACGQAWRRPCRGRAANWQRCSESRLEDPATIPFAVTDGRTGALLGTTSLRDYVPAQQRLEIGGTFYGRQFWGSHVNPASKHMLLAYAYEVLEVHRVAFRCDARNTRSATAIERLGAQFEGILRGHRRRPAEDGRTPPSFRSSRRSGRKCAKTFGAASPPSPWAPTTGSAASPPPRNSYASGVGARASAGGSASPPGSGGRRSSFASP